MVVFRCDGTEMTGLGHLSRCLAIADSVARKGEEVVFYGLWSEHASRMIEGSGFRCVDRDFEPEEGSLISYLDTKTEKVSVVLDHYKIGLEAQRKIANCCLHFFLIDDFGALKDYGHCSQVLNFTVRAEEYDYPGLSRNKLLAGPRFFPASRELRTLREKTVNRKYGKPIRRLLVTLGGFADATIYREILDALGSIRNRGEEFELRCIVSESALKDAALSEYLEILTGPITSLSASFDWADACIVGGGLTKYECSFLGIPGAIRSITEEQQGETSGFQDLGLCFDLGSDSAKIQGEITRFIKEHEMRERISNSCLKRFDSESTDRIAERLTS